MDDEMPGFVKVILVLMVIVLLATCTAGEILDRRAQTICISNGYYDGESEGFDYVNCLTKFKLDTQYNLLEE